MNNNGEGRFRRRNSAQGLPRTETLGTMKTQPESETLVIKGGSSLGKVFRAVRHVHQNRERYRCDLYLDKLSLRVPSAKKVCVEWMRGPHRVKSAHVPTLHKNVWTCSWPTPLSLNATLFSTSASGEKKFATKETTIRFLEFNSAKSKNPERLGEVVLDLADIISNPGKYSHITKPLSRSLDPSARLTFRLQCTSLAGEASELSDTSSLPDDHLSEADDRSTHRRLFRRRQSLRNIILGSKPEPDSENQLPGIRGDASPLTSDPESGSRVRGLQSPVHRRGSVSESAPPIIPPKKLRGANHLLTSPTRGALFASADVLSTPLKDIDEGDQEDSVTDRYQSLKREFDRSREQQLRDRAAERLEFDLKLQNMRDEHQRVLKDLESQNVKIITSLDRALVSYGINEDALPGLTPSVDAKLSALEQHFAKLKVELDRNREMIRSDGSPRELISKLEQQLQITESANREIVMRTDDERRMLHEELKAQQQANKTLKKQMESLANRYEIEKQHFCDQIASLQDQLAGLQGQSSLSDCSSPLSHLTKTELIAKLQRFEQAANLSDVPRTVADLEEQLICAKVQLAQAETEKEELLERARKRIEDLKETAKSYATMLSDMEEKVAELKMQRPSRIGSQSFADESADASSGQGWAKLATKKLVRGATTAIKRAGGGRASTPSRTLVHSAEESMSSE